MKTLSGISAVDGVALATPHFLHTHSIGSEQTISFLDAIKSVKLDITARLNTGNKDQQEIFAAHLMMLEDPEFLASIESKMKNNLPASVAVREASEEFAGLLSQLDDPYMRERATDIRDIGQQLINSLLGKKNPLGEIQRECILVMHELTPSIVSDLNPKLVLGIVAETGGVTSHAAILLKNRQIPAVFGIENAGNLFANRSPIFLDGSKGLIHYDLSDHEKRDFLEIERNWKSQQMQLAELKDIEVFTRDRVRIQLLSNINLPTDVDAALANGADGVGLMRTEFLFMDAREAPSEETQFKIYRKVLEAFPGKKVTIRTLDIGGDKPLPYLQIKKEENPFLGLRGLRLSLQESTLFRTQLRALMRASRYGSLDIMFPMVTELKEFLAAKNILEEEKRNLDPNSIGNYRLGLMVEVPACALQLEDFMKDADFFSVGTNDLTQYLCAVDRLNSTVAHLYHYSHPALHSLLKMIIEQANKHGKDISICGEMAGKAEFTSTLLKLGLRNFSVSPGNLLRLKKSILDSSI